MKKVNLTLAFMLISVVFLIGGILLAAYTDIPTAAKVIVLIITVILFLLFTVLACETERRSGIFICPKCGHAFEVSAARFIFSPHVGRTRCMSCPRCGKKSYCGYRVKEN